MVINERVLCRVAEKSIRNAQSLIADAVLLRNNNRIARAYTLYQFAVEEVGKALASAFLVLRPDALTPDNIKEYKKSFLSHRKKIKQSRAMDTLICQLLYKGNPDEALSFLEGAAKEDAEQLDTNKNNSLYTNIIGEEVLCPEEMITEAMMKYIEFRALTRYKFVENFIKAHLANYNELRNALRSYQPPSFEDLANTFWNEIVNTDQKTN